METLRYRGRTVTAADVGFIRELIASDPGASRRRLSEKLCTAWGWVQPNGELRSMVCRGLMLELARAGAPVEERFLGHRVRIAYDADRQVFEVEAPPQVEIVEGFWFAWAAFHPDTSVFLASEAPHQNSR